MAKETKVSTDAYGVFISHASEDTEWCEKLATKLKELGLEVWFDKWALQTIETSVAAAINRGLAASRHVLVVMTWFYFDDKKDWTIANADFSTSSDPDDSRGFLIPILRETCKVPPVWHSRTFLDFRDEANFDNNCRVLTDALRRPPEFELPTQALETSGEPVVINDSSLGESKIEIPQAHRLRAFLCHSSDDKPAVRRLYHRLVDDGIDPWLDEKKLLPGQDWQYEIWKAVRTSDNVIVCLSRNSITKEGFVQKEIKYALDVAEEKPEGTLFLIPVKLEECNTPERLRRWHWLDFFEEESYEKLMRSLRNRADELGLSS